MKDPSPPLSSDHHAPPNRQRPEKTCGTPRPPGPQTFRASGRRFPLQPGRQPGPDPGLSSQLHPTPHLLPHPEASLHHREGHGSATRVLRDPRPFLAPRPGGRPSPPGPAEEQTMRTEQRQRRPSASRFPKRDWRPAPSRAGSTWRSAPAGPGVGWTRTAPPPPPGSPSTWEPRNLREMRAPGWHHQPVTNPLWRG